VAHAWTQVLHTLPLLAEGDPDPNFVGAVLAATLSIIPVVIVFLFAQRYIVEGIARSGIKG
jgi:multiple sugar transport system permease protein